MNRIDLIKSILQTCPALFSAQELLSIMKFDPNDLLTASCCGAPVSVYSNGTWSCETCGTIDKERSKITDAVRKDSFNPYGNHSYKPKCECGAEKTSNQNCHAFWCPRYGK